MGVDPFFSLSFLLCTTTAVGFLYIGVGRLGGGIGIGIDGISFSIGMGAEWCREMGMFYVTRSTFY
jgi:hypothetical protein